MGANFKKVIITVVVVLIAFFVYTQFIETKDDEKAPNLRVSLQDLKEKYKNNSNSNNTTNAQSNYDNTTSTDSSNSQNNDSDSKPARSDKKVSLDTTGNYNGLRLKRVSDSNDFVAAEIKNNTANKASRLKGTEEPLILAVEKFNDYQKSYSKFIAYKVVEYKEFSKSELSEHNDDLRSSGRGTSTETCRVTLKIYQYEPSSGSTYEETQYDPQYYRMLIDKIDGEYTITSSITVRG